MDLISKIKDNFESDFDLDEDDYFSLMEAVVKLFKNTKYNNLPCDQVTKDLVSITLNFGQPTVGGSHCDYAITDFLNAVDGHYRITEINSDFVEFLKEGINSYALNQTLELEKLRCTVNRL